ncbi:MAG: lamin tail domain-containing protein [Ignavibacteriaceae bacterium]
MKKNILHSVFVLLTLLMISNSYAQSPVRLNEIFSRATSPDLDWIEIYNTSATAFDMSGYKIYDSGGQSGTKPKKEFPVGSIIPANGFLVIVTDDTSESGFGLSSSGEQVWLEDTGGTIVDEITFPALAVTESYGRILDGGTWQILSTITRGISNVILSVNYVFANEVYSRGTTNDPDWIEIYNTSSTSIDISGYKIYDSGGQAGTKPKKEFPIGSLIAANGFLVIVTDDTSASGFGISNSGETVWIENNSGTLIDSVVIPALQTSESYSKIPDGAVWYITGTVTKGTTNIYSSTSDIVMNEIYSRGSNDNPDWIEIYNLSASSVDLTGYKIYDSGGQTGTKPKKEFPAGSIIPANGFLVIITDDTLDSGFGLSSSGEEVWLEDTTGTVIDNVTFLAMADTQSYSRIPDGNSNWQLTDYITKGFANTITSVDDMGNSILDYMLYQNYPNPFNPATRIEYSLPVESNVKIVVYNLIGEVVKELINSNQLSGKHSVSFNGVDLSSGVYFYSISAVSLDGSKSFNNTAKMILLK